MLLVWGALSWSVWGCTDVAPALSSPRIESVSPEPLSPGDRVVIRGVFGPSERRSAVSIGGVPCPILTWAERRITVHAAALPAGQQLLVVTDGSGTRAAPYAVFVTGATAQSDAARRFPEGADAAVLRVQDAGAPPDTGPQIPLDVSLTADPAGGQHVRLVEQPSEPGLLTISVELPAGAEPPWGVAFHLRWDPGLLRFEGAEGIDSQLVAFGALGPGRLAFGRVLDGEWTAVQITFRAIGRGEGRLSFPIHHRDLRDLNNRSLPDQRWAGAAIRVVERSR